MRFMLGMTLLAAIAAGLIWAWYRFIWTRLPSTRLRRATTPHDMIDVPLAPDQDGIQRPAGAGSARSTGRA
jgi:hypothetical protein